MPGQVPFEGPGESSQSLCLGLYCPFPCIHHIPPLLIVWRVFHPSNQLFQRQLQV